MLVLTHRLVFVSNRQGGMVSPSLGGGSGSRGGGNNSQIFCYYCIAVCSGKYNIRSMCNGNYCINFNCICAFDKKRRHLTYFKLLYGVSICYFVGPSVCLSVNHVCPQFFLREGAKNSFRGGVQTNFALFKWGLDIFLGTKAPLGLGHVIKKLSK